MLISPMNYVISDPVADITRLSLALLETCTSKGIRRITVYAPSPLPPPPILLGEISINCVEKSQV